MWAHYSASHTGICLKFDITKDSDVFLITHPVKYSEDYPKFDYLKERGRLVNKAILTKSKEWKYENEIRVLKPKFGPQSFNKAALKEIIFGCNTPDDKIKHISKIVKDAKYPDLKMKKAVINRYSFKIVIHDI